MCDRPEKAMTELKRCAEGGLPNYRAFEKDPHLRSLHSHPDFLALIRQLRRDYEAFRDEFDLSETYAPQLAPSSASHRVPISGAGPTTSKPMR